MAAALDPPSTTFRLVTWNVNSLTSALPSIKLSKLYGSLDALFRTFGDVLCLQEVKLFWDKMTKEVAYINGWESFWATSRTKKGYSGVTTWAASPAFSPVAAASDCLGIGEGNLDQEGRVVVTDHSEFVLFNVYVPNAGYNPPRCRLPLKLAFLRALKEKADGYTAAGRKVVLVGDFNVAMTTKDVAPFFKGDFEAGDMYTPEEHDIMAQLLAGYHDVWRELHPDVSDQFTVWDEKKEARSRNHGIRIDYVLVSKNMRHQVLSCEIVGIGAIPPKWSDHAAMVVHFSGVAPVPAHEPCPQSSLRDVRWNDPRQRKLSDMFGLKPKPPPAPAAAAPPPMSTAAPAPAASTADPSKEIDEPQQGSLAVAPAAPALAAPAACDGGEQHGLTAFASDGCGDDGDGDAGRPPKARRLESGEGGGPGAAADATTVGSHQQAGDRSGVAGPSSSDCGGAAPPTGAEHVATAAAASDNSKLAGAACDGGTRPTEQRAATGQATKGPGLSGKQTGKGVAKPAAKPKGKGGKDAPPDKSQRSIAGFFSKPPADKL
ncbi:hypothetical protein FOA52_003108 [Chlamydomonas sp. UWO 241]|nr:hypothetical protein FOA52_003108 [Chlamydomonas sp. UWO 241]